MVTTIILILGGVLLAALAVIFAPTIAAAMSFHL